MSIGGGLVWCGEDSLGAPFLEELGRFLTDKLSSVVATDFFRDVEAAYDVILYVGDDFLFAYLCVLTCFHPLGKIVSKNK